MLISRLLSHNVFIISILVGSPDTKENFQQTWRADFNVHQGRKEMEKRELGSSPPSQNNRPGSRVPVPDKQRDSTSNAMAVRADSAAAQEPKNNSGAGPP
ncbi:hypothetical protein SADUNF_Sadunf13G0034200 [Salix dunnii]|uniref:Uncharacterized protein n=1 Tax=Salix dunnii TaxID=1413687 RepID=A0A835JI45_9ROSI|nr:hypothetical protein SADUNF_Sadunf13G0034200 [Salix dunnii]